MKRTPIPAVFFLSVALLWAALPATDSFDNGGLNRELTVYSTNWSYATTGNLQVVGDGLAGFNGVSMAYWNADTFADDQYSKAVMVYGNIFGSTGVAARATAGSGGNGYYAVPRDVSYSCCTVYFGRLDNGIATDLWNQSLSGMATGDVVLIEVSGSNPVSVHVTVSRTTKGDRADYTYTDSSASRKTSGKPGIFAYQGGEIDLRVDSWEGGNLFGGAPIAVRRRILR
jgi:hypothetical protein